jgi:hypothetical protein
LSTWLTVWQVYYVIFATQKAIDKESGDNGDDGVTFSLESLGTIYNDSGDILTMVPLKVELAWLHG